MKKITRLFMAIVMVAFVGVANAQTTINFETVGQDWAWTIFENGDNAASLYSVVSNPSATGINTSAKCAKFIVNANGQPWAGAWSANLPDFTFTAQNCFVKVKVYKNVISNFDVKFENDNASVAFEKLVSNTKVNEWEELTFDFSAHIGKAVTKLVIIPDFPSARTAGSINYWDDLTFTSGSITPIAEPTVAAATPIHPAANVISLFSNAYTNVPVNTWRTDWSNAAYSAVQIAGNDTKKYSELVFVGIETVGTNMINATSMSYLHVDLWTPNMTTFKVKLVDFGANGAYQGGDDVEHEVTLTPTLSGWNSYNLALSSFTNLTTRAHIAQLIFSGSPTGVAYIDNIYFHNVTTGIENLYNDKSIKVYPTSVSNDLNIKSEKEMSQVIIRNLLGQNIKTIAVSGLEKSIDLSTLSAGNYFVTVKLDSGLVSTYKIVKL